jgi:hypothetical protein
VTHDRYGTFTGRGCSIASRLRRLDMPSAPAAAAKHLHRRFAFTATNADVWPLSPKDWSTG